MSVRSRDKQDAFDLAGIPIRRRPSIDRDSKATGKPLALPVTGRAKVGDLSRLPVMGEG